MTLEARTRALLDLVEADRERRCATALDAARDRAAAMRAAAHAEARRRVCETFAEERRRFATRMDAARAALQTHHRLREQRRAAEFLAMGLASLPEVLCARWQNADSRDAWIDRVVAEAHAALPRGRWRIGYAPGWPDGERDARMAPLAEICGAAPDAEADPAFRAGLRIVADGNVVDGTLGGLLADRVDIGARLLTRLEDA